MSTTLTWSLCISTLNRVEILSACVRLALRQQRPPGEVVIVDASEDWTANRDRIAAEIAAEAGADAPPLTYVRAEARSLTRQRNQGIALCRSDVLFLIDDDSMMYPDCAAEAMAVYEADPELRIACVGLSPVPVPPGRDAANVARKDGKTDAGARLERNPVFRFIRRHLLMQAADLHFIAYDGPLRDDRPLPGGLAPDQAAPTLLIPGYLITARRSVAAAERFDPGLLAYCPGEDLDATYRFARHGRNVTARRARVYHHEAASGRIRRYRAIRLALMNQAYLLRKHSRRLPRHVALYGWRMVRRIPAEALKDALTRRWSFPQLRGALAAAAEAPIIFMHDRADLDRWYETRQRRVLEA